MIKKETSANLKKYGIILFSLVTLLIMATACGKSAEQEDKLDANELLERGLICSFVSSDPESWKALIQTEGSYDEVYLAEAKIDEAKYDEYANISMEDEKAAREAVKAYVASLKDVKVTDFKDQIPAENTFDDYIGKTIADLESEGYENSGYTFGDEGAELFYDGPKYCLSIQIEKSDENVEKMDEEDFSPLHISSVTFTGFSSRILEEE